MISFFLLIAVAFAGTSNYQYYYIGPEGYTIDTSPIVFWVRDESPLDGGYEHDRCSFKKCIEDKGYHFKIFPDQEWDPRGSSNIDSTTRTFTWQYFAKSQCDESNKMPDRAMKLVYYTHVPSKGKYSVEEMEKKYPLWIHYSSSSAGSESNKILQFSKPGCINDVGFEFTFTSKGCYHHLYAPKSQCKGVDTIAKYVKNETWGSGQYHVKDGYDEKIDPNDRFAEGDPGFFFYIDLEEVLKYTTDDKSIDKYYEYLHGSLRIYKRVGTGDDSEFVYWQDAMKNPSEKNKIATGYKCSGKTSCDSVGSGTEHIMTTECVGGKVFVPTCDEIIRARKKKVTNHCNSVFTDEDTTIIVATDRQGVMYFNESYYHIILPETKCPVKSCNGDDMHLTEFFYRVKTVTTDKIENGDKRSIIYQYVPYAGKNYILALYYKDDKYTEIDYETNAVIEGEHAEQCWHINRKELHFYTHRSMAEAEACGGYGVGRADFFQIAECHDGQFFYVEDRDIIDVYECEDGDQYWDINTAMGVGNTKLYDNIIYGPQTIFGIDYHVVYDVSISFYDSYDNWFEPDICDECKPFLVDNFVPGSEQPVDPNPGEGDDEEDDKPVDPKPSESEGKPGEDVTPAQSSNNKPEDTTPTESEGKPDVTPAQSESGKPEDNTPTESEGKPEDNTPTQSSNSQPDNTPAQSESGKPEDNTPAQSSNSKPDEEDDSQDGAKSLFTFALLVILFLF